MKIGEPDAEQWLEDVPDRVFENWKAHYAVEPWGNEQYLLSKIVSLLSVLIAFKSGDSKQIESLADNMPPNWFYRPEEAEKKPVGEQIKDIGDAFEKLGF